jgi:hypothetical protein
MTTRAIRNQIIHKYQHRIPTQFKYSYKLRKPQQ